MKKVMISVIAIITLFIAPTITNTVKAQIFLDDKDRNSCLYGVKPEEEEEEESFTAKFLAYDEYAPLGGEIFVLGLLGGAYLFGKKRRAE